MNLPVTRRQFLGTSAAAVIVAGMKAQGTVIGANNRIRLCTIGFNGQGGSHIRDILAFPKNQNGRDLMADCPSPVAPKQLRDLRIRLVEDEPKA